MQTSSPIVKTTALVCFVVLLSGFVAYRSGVFDKQAIKTKAIYSALDDTTKKPIVDTSAERLIMSSSKSMIIIDNRKSSKKDTVPATIKKDTCVDHLLKRIRQRMLLLVSKSAMKRGPLLLEGLSSTSMLYACS